MWSVLYTSCASLHLLGDGAKTYWDIHPLLLYLELLSWFILTRWEATMEIGVGVL